MDNEEIKITSINAFPKSSYGEGTPEFYSLLNAAVARKLGKPDVDKAWHQQTHAHTVNYEGTCMHGCGYVGEGYSVAPYSTSILAAFEVFEYMRRAGLDVELTGCSYPSGWHIACRRDSYADEGFDLVANEIAATAPMAICTAFLKLP